MTGDPAFADEKPDYQLISREVLPALQEAAVSAAQIEQMLVGNARAFLGRN